MSNRTKGMGGHQSAKAFKDEWLTPPEIVNALGKFDLDPCSPINRPWPTAEKHLTILDDGLTKDWPHNKRVFLNAPYGQALWLWMQKLAEHGTGTSLLFARTETKGFCRWVWDEATAVLFIQGRLHFHHVTGERAPRNSGAPSVLAAYGQDDADILHDSGINGKFIPLRVPMLIAANWEPESETWTSLVVRLAKKQGGSVKVSALYDLVRSHSKTKNNANWQAKVRQTLQRGPFTRTARGLWEIESATPL